jgi:hypothetical protein
MKAPVVSLSHFTDEQLELIAQLTVYRIIEARLKTDSEQDAEGLANLWRDLLGIYTEQAIREMLNGRRERSQCLQ